MKRCSKCGRAVDSESGMVNLRSCPWCKGELVPDDRGPQDLSDAIQMLYSIDPCWPYLGSVATTNLLDLAPKLVRERRRIGIASETGALDQLREGRVLAAMRSLTEEGWNENVVESFIDAYANLSPSATTLPVTSLQKTDEHANEMLRGPQSHEERGCANTGSWEQAVHLTGDPGANSTFIAGITHHIENILFSPSKHGYDTAEVDALLDDLSLKLAHQLSS